MNTSFVDESGATRLRGRLAGGGGPSSEGAYIGGTPVSINDGAQKRLPWVRLLGDPVLDLSVPDRPTAIVAGMYVFTVMAASTAPLTAGGWALLLGLSGTSQQAQQATRPEAAFGVTFAARLAPADLITVAVENHDGAVARDFQILSAVVTVLPS